MTLSQSLDYFFYLYIVAVAAELWLVMLALLNWPTVERMEAIPGMEGAYEVGGEAVRPMGSPYQE